MLLDEPGGFFYNGILQHTVAQIKKKIGAIRMSVIEVNRLTKDYGHGRGVFDVSARVDKGECFGFLGPNLLRYKLKAM